MYSVATAERFEIGTPHLPGPDWNCTHCRADLRRGEPPERWPCIPAQVHLLRVYQQSPYYVEWWLMYHFARAAHHIGDGETVGQAWQRFFGFLPDLCSRGLCRHQQGRRRNEAAMPSLTIVAAVRGSRAPEIAIAAS